MKKGLVLIGIAALAAMLAGCSLTQTSLPLPTNRPILYNCDDGSQLTVDFQGEEARVAVIGGPSMALANQGTAEAPLYTNGRYTLRGRGAQADWAVGRSAYVHCTGR